MAGERRTHQKGQLRKMGVWTQEGKNRDHICHRLMALLLILPRGRAGDGRQHLTPEKAMGCRNVVRGLCLTSLPLATPLPGLFCASNLSSWRLRRNGWSISKYRMSWAWKLWEPQKLTCPCLEKNDLGWASFEKFLLVSHPNLSLSNSQRTVPVVASRPCAGQSCAPFQVRAGPGSAGDVTGGQQRHSLCVRARARHVAGWQRVSLYIQAIQLGSK